MFGWFLARCPPSTLGAPGGPGNLPHNIPGPRCPSGGNQRTQMFGCSPSTPWGCGCPPSTPWGPRHWAAHPAPHGDGSSHKTWVFGCPYCGIGDTSLSSGCLTVAGRTGHDSPQRQPVMGGHPMTGDRTGVAVTPWHQWQRGSGTRQPPNHRLAPQTASSPTKSLPPPLWAEARGCLWHGTAVMGLPRLDAGVPS